MAGAEVGIPHVHLEIEVPWWFWVVFHVVIAVFIAIDLAWAWGGKHRPTLKSTTVWFLVWVLVACIFGVYIFLEHGYVAGLLYFTAYAVEKSLSADNMFVFAVIFTYFAVPLEYQTKTLYIGVLTAVILRAIFIAAGMAAIEAWRPVVYIFAAILFYSGYKLLRAKEVSVEPERNPLVRLAKKYLPITTSYYKDKFIVRVKGGSLHFTPLILVLLTIESSDVMFAIDSVPAVIAITENFFLAYTSNIMAILGLRQLYFFIAILAFRLKYLSKGLCLVLMFLGLKIILTETGIYKIPVLLSVAIVLSILAVSAIASVIVKEKGAKEEIQKHH